MNVVHAPASPAVTPRCKAGAAAAAAALVIGVASLGLAAPAQAAKKVPRAKLADRAKNADRVDKLSASKTPKSGQLLALDSTGKFPIGVIPVSQLPKAPTYGAGFGLGLAGNTFFANPAVLQRRVTQLCPAGQAIREIKADGTIACQAITAASGGDITAVDTAAGSGLTGGAATGDVTLSSDFNVIQRRVAACPAGQAIRSVNVAGAPTCQAVGTVTAPINLTASLPNGAVASFNNTNSSGSGSGPHGVVGQTHQIGTGVWGLAISSGIGVVGENRGDGTGVAARAGGMFAAALSAEATGASGVAVRGSAPGSGALAGLFVGDVSVQGTLSKAAGSFKIDHPLDPANRYLQHSFVESPDMKNVYDGVTATDARGYATVKLPDYFQALNRTFRYQLTTIRSFSRAIVWREVNDNQFVIRSEDPRVKVSWQVTGIRHDAYAKKHPIVVDTPKAKADRGRYLNPDAFGKPAHNAIGHRSPRKP